MSDNTRLKSLRVVLVLLGVTFIVGLPLFMFFVWQSGWAWHTGHSDYPAMIVGVYATLGIFLILAARDPLANRSLILFTAWSTIVHAVIMTVQSFESSANHGHLVGDVPALYVAAVALFVLMPKRTAGTITPPRTA